ncbi:PREDICTED: uncharacterized protein LOC106746767 isoform X2 [Dinoponera quadriceps]|uniref:Uncharacterized protein LOC106746767 isoform X2 n=1 Tax=Dinoponera quadriceps TaxID=609295 RepID=A0A6P3XMP7_DINQU|nr:PREDICTED: uncharacterized protein LOC106746767 isoform X2 [Dinoponera quadriceps]
MIVFAWSLFVITLIFVTGNQAFLNAPLPAHTVSTYSIGADRGTDNNKMTHGVNDNRHSVVSKFDDDDDNDDDDETVYVIEYNEENRGEKNVEKGKNTDVKSDPQNPLDPWSIVWYIGSFGGLVAFFLIVSCSEWCCRRAARPLAMPYAQPTEVMSSRGVAETPPPPYHLFAPPPYDSVNYGDIVDKTSGEKLDIYVISVPTVHRPVVQAPA